MFSIVIVTKDRKDDLLFTLRKLEVLHKNDKQPYFEVVVVDNCSKNDIGGVCELFSWVTLLKLEKNKAMAATNDAISVCKFEYIMTLDDDATPDDQCLIAAKNLFENNIVDAIECEIIEGGVVVNECKDGETINFIGCGAFFKKKVLVDVGGYSEVLNWSGNEKDLIYRLVLNGYFIEHSSLCKVNHRRSIVNRSWAAGVESNMFSAVVKSYTYHSAIYFPIFILIALLYNIKRSSEEGGVDLKTFKSVFNGFKDGSKYCIDHGNRTLISRENNKIAAELWRRRYKVSFIVSLFLPSKFWY